jgi:hypothetical protein
MFIGNKFRVSLLFCIILGFIALFGTIGILGQGVQQQEAGRVYGMTSGQYGRRAGAGRRGHRCAGSGPSRRSSRHRLRATRSDPRPCRGADQHGRRWVDRSHLWRRIRYRRRASRGHRCRGAGTDRHRARRAGHVPIPRHQLTRVSGLFPFRVISCNFVVP